jgi:hypothetical protein
MLVVNSVARKLRVHQWLMGLMLCWLVSNFVFWYGILSANVWHWDWDKYFITKHFPAGMPQVLRLGFAPANPTQADVEAAVEWGKGRFPFIAKSNGCTTLGVGVYFVKVSGNYLCLNAMAHLAIGSKRARSRPALRVEHRGYDLTRPR